MTAISEKLDKTIEQVFEKIKSQNLSGWKEKPGSGKWSKNEILGHLIDSALNNIQRFVRGTYEEKFKLIYDQDRWVSTQHYRLADTKELLQLWLLLNRQIVRILKNYPGERRTVLCDTGKQEASFHSIDFLAKDYLDHLQHHLKQLGLD